MNCLPDLPSTRSKNCTFDICWHFSISMNYILKIFPIKFEKCLPTIRKESPKLQFSLFVYLFGNLYRKFAGKLRSIIFVIDLHWKAKQGFVTSHRTPTFQPWEATYASFARYLYFLTKKNCFIVECQPSSSYRECNSRLFRAFAVNIAVFSRNQAGVIES